MWSWVSSPGSRTFLAKELLPASAMDTKAAMNDPFTMPVMFFLSCVLASGR
jgi:hypothetical protein